MALDRILLIDNLPVVDLLELVDFGARRAEPRRAGALQRAPRRRARRAGPADYPLARRPAPAAGRRSASIIVDDGVGQQACRARPDRPPPDPHRERATSAPGSRSAAAIAAWRSARAHRTVAWSGRDSDIVGTILAGYGLVPDVAQTYTPAHRPQQHPEPERQRPRLPQPARAAQRLSLLDLLSASPAWPSSRSATSSPRAPRPRRPRRRRSVIDLFRARAFDQRRRPQRRRP